MIKWILVVMLWAPITPPEEDWGSKYVFKTNEHALPLFDTFEGCKIYAKLIYSSAMGDTKERLNVICIPKKG